jgi:hypothetical protein
VSARERAIRAHRTLLNSGKLSYFEERGISAETLKAAWVGYDAASRAFTYPSITRGGLLGIHYKSERRDKNAKAGSGGEGTPTTYRGKGTATGRTIRRRSSRSALKPSFGEVPARQPISTMSQERASTYAPRIHLRLRPYSGQALTQKE